jgi:hypothetical protein
MTTVLLIAQVVILDIVSLVKDHPHVVVNVQKEDMKIQTMLAHVFVMMVLMMIMVSVNHVIINV